MSDHADGEKTLWILRHGDAAHQAPRDDLRELTSHGIRQIQQQAQFIAQQAVVFDAMWVSPYVRAQQSAQALQLECAPSQPFHTLELLQPDSSVSELVTYLSRHAPEHLLLVSHQPLVNRLINVLCEGNDRSGRAEFLNTASLACLRSHEWASGWANLTCMQHAID